MHGCTIGILNCHRERGVLVILYVQENRATRRGKITTKGTVAAHTSLKEREGVGVSAYLFLYRKCSLFFRGSIETECR